jgi:hypothetical protein
MNLRQRDRQAFRSLHRLRSKAASCDQEGILCATIPSKCLQYPYIGGFSRQCRREATHHKTLSAGLCIEDARKVLLRTRHQVIILLCQKKVHFGQKIVWRKGLQAFGFLLCENGLLLAAKNLFLMTTVRFASVFRTLLRLLSRKRGFLKTIYSPLLTLLSFPFASSRQ